MNKIRVSIILGIMCFLLTYGIAIQIKTVNSNGTTVSTSQTESTLKTQVLKMKEKYEEKYKELEKAEKQLEIARQNATNNNEELENLENEIKEANKILGLTDVTGQGVTATLTDGLETSNMLDPESVLVHAENVLAVVNELKNAGTEAISINGKRVVTSTSIMCDGNVIVVNGEKISSPIQIMAIGLPEQLYTLKRAGGTLSLYESKGKIVEMTKSNKITIPKYAGVISFKYAKTV